MDEIKRKIFVKTLKQLESYRGRHTELISVYVPQGFNILKIAEQLRNEQSTAQNIKSKTTRKNVLSALEKILQHLKLYRETPKNGLAIFCGNISEKEGVSDIELWAIEPPEPLKVKMYRCDQTFLLEPLKEMIREKDVYGLIVLDKSEADIGILKGKRIESLKHLDSIVPGKTKAGGWSANRYARIREGLLEDFMKKIAEIANAQFKDKKDLKGIIIGGPGPIKEEFAKKDFFFHTLKRKILGIIDTSYAGEYGLRETVERAEELIKESSIMHEKKILDRFFNELAKDGLAVYGFDDVIEALEGGNLELLLISEDFDWIKIKLKCKNCGYETEKTIKEEFVKDEKCEKCGGDVDILEKKEIIDEITKTAENMGTHVEIISTETSKGIQLKELGGIAGILRFKT